MSIEKKTSYAGMKGMGRRALLRGAGTVAVGLPFLGIMNAGGGARAAGDVPPRLLTAFFANGWPPGLFQPSDVGTSYTLPDVLTALQPFRDKLTVVSGLDYAAGGLDGPSEGKHSKGNGIVYTGTPNANFTDGEANGTEGPTIDVFLHQTLDPSGDRPLLALAAMDRLSGPQIWHAKSFGGPTEAHRPTLDPSVAFELIFGSPIAPDGADTGGGGAPDRAELRRRRYAVSVLDTVLGEYHRVTSPRFGLDGESRRMISQHLDRIRDLERRVLAFAAHAGSGGGGGAGCAPGEAPPSMRGYDHADYPEAYRLHAELFAMAMRCDAVRFGSLMFCRGTEAYTLPEARSEEHQTAHNEYGKSSRNSCGCEGLPEDYLVYKRHQMDRLAELLGALDDPSYLEPNGRTLLDNMIVVAGTELGPPAHSIDDTTYLVAGTAAGQIRPAHHRFDGRANNDLLSALVNYAGVDVASFGDERVAGAPLDLG